MFLMSLPHCTMTVSNYNAPAPFGTFSVYIHIIFKLALFTNIPLFADLINVYPALQYINSYRHNRVLNLTC
jgi:hypothetical protein